MTHADRTIRLASGLTVALRSWGHSGDHPTLAIHGWVDNAASFSALAPLLGDSHFVALDLPGHGQSDWKAQSAEYAFVGWVAVVGDVVDALGWDEFDLVGHSMGAGIAGLFAGTFPDRVRSLVMIEGLGPYTTAPDAAIDNLRRAIEARPRQFGRQPRRMESLAEAVTRKLAALEYLTPDAAEALVRRGTRPTDDGGVAFSHDPRLTARSLLRFTDEHVVECFRRIACPTLVIWASDGLEYPPEAGDADARLAAIDDVEVVEVDGDHHVHLTHAERVAAVIDDWYQRQE